MEFKQVVMSRRSVRAYLDKSIPQNVLEEIIEAGLYAPSATNLQPWYFVVISSEEQREKLTTVMKRVADSVEGNLRKRFAKHPQVVNSTLHFLRSLGGAPTCVLAFCQKPDYPYAKEIVLQSVAAAIENILLAAVDHGLGGCWMTAPIEAMVGDELRDTFADGKGQLVAALTLGYPAGEQPSAPPRKEDRYKFI